MAGGAQDAGGLQESEGLLRECQHCLAHVARQVG